MSDYRRCPKCGCPMIEDDNPVFRQWWCVVCGYMDKKWKDERKNMRKNRNRT